ncbi:hypothetical protein R3W88_004437 [Solanum pinnatisectum]|uniref:Uncharacterized protein n=1 Tax=Solanum pinnatisectum TaxID=50273 RepID=A0AAV9KBD7_9SOLN|nr:hypothetical protein R3W88_004437 [Solanum pinnatisectum]
MFLKFAKSSSVNLSLFTMAPVATFMLSLVAQAVVPFDYGMILSDSALSENTLNRYLGQVKRDGTQQSVSYLKVLHATP